LERARAPGRSDEAVSVLNDELNVERGTDSPSCCILGRSMSVLSFPPVATITASPVYLASDGEKKKFFQTIFYCVNEIPFFVKELDSSDDELIVGDEIETSSSSSPPTPKKRKIETTNLVEYPLMLEKRGCDKIDNTNSTKFFQILKELLHPSIPPERMFRDKEINQLALIFQKGESQVVLISGEPGSGKTFTAHCAMRQFQEKATCVQIDCHLFLKSEDVYFQLAKNLFRDDKITKKDAFSRLVSFFEKKDPNEKLIIICLDQLDTLNQKVIEKFVTWPSSRKNLIVVGILNAILSTNDNLMHELRTSSTVTLPKFTDQ
jgi:hypothetical protein